MTLHLRSFRGYQERFSVPPEITQDGIASAVGIKVNHIPRTMKKPKKTSIGRLRVKHWLCRIILSTPISIVDFLKYLIHPSRASMTT